MTSTLLAIALAAAGAPSGQVPAFFTGERLYRVCQRDNWDCPMYVSGVIDGIFLSEEDATRPSICRARLTNQEAARRVMRYLAENPEERFQAAAVIVRDALAEPLACDATPQQTRQSEIADR